jgi:peptide/nickel transport system permease protein
VGAVAGFFGRVVDEAMMRVTDLFFSFPPIILAMVITASLGPGLLNAALALSVVSWPNYARVSRSLVLSAKQEDYVVAGRLMGAGSVMSLWRDVTPNVISPILVLACLEFGNAILLLSGLSFLGLGAIPPTPDWGGMVSAGVSQFSDWWIALFPGLAILTIVAGVNLIGDSLRDSLDPHTSQAMEGGRGADA